MTDNELKRLARFIVEAQASNPQWMMANAKAQAELRRKDTEAHWVNTKVAAEILGLSVRTVRDIKDYFVYVKRGTEKQSCIYFDANKLSEGYDKYLASSSKVVPISMNKAIGM